MTSHDEASVRSPGNPQGEADDFRAVIGTFPTGVAIVTTSVDGIRYGMTASSLTSVSLAPPALLVCLNRSSPTNRALRVAGSFGVNILDDTQIVLAERFATPSKEKFDGLTIKEGPDGIPLLLDALALIKCSVIEEFRCGTHSVFLARVHRATSREGSALVHFRGSYTRLEAEP